MEKKFTFNIPLEKQSSYKRGERKKERGEKKSSISLLSPEPLFIWWNQRRFPTGFSFRASTIHEFPQVRRGFSTNRHTGEGAVFCPSSPIYSPAIRFHPTRREGRQKCIFRERFAVIGSHHPHENVRFLNVIRPESVAVFVFAHR